jgi:hypothetical protein
MFNGKLCEFENEYPDFDEETDEYKEMFVKIYKLNLIDKIKWRWKQWKFEKIIGYHWTYPQRKEGKGFYYRKPKWLYILLFNLYYRRK